MNHTASGVDFPQVGRLRVLALDLIVERFAEAAPETAAAVVACSGRLFLACRVTASGFAYAAVVVVETDAEGAPASWGYWEEPGAGSGLAALAPGYGIASIAAAGDYLYLALSNGVDSLLVSGELVSEAPAWTQVALPAGVEGSALALASVSEASYLLGHTSSESQDAFAWAPRSSDGSIGAWVTIELPRNTSWDGAAAQPRVRFPAVHDGQIIFLYRGEAFPLSATGEPDVELRSFQSPWADYDAKADLLCTTFTDSLVYYVAEGYDEDCMVFYTACWLR